ncbi:uncharacterized protein LOC124365256 [Homalodisca vitripennis]|uniref:uncharacterized protein LOC124365256 n=1 Tax=Homalodisca vitripennis TaxID=197043 RepID=UPI001EE9EF9E|nr:uncharacterized protein LOC124365256 [Homalodisca vitripennis]
MSVPVAQLVSVVVLVALVGAQNECMPPKPGEKHAHPSECCKLDTVIPESVKVNGPKCMEKFPHPPKPPGPPPSGAMPTPDPAMKLHHACVGECVFSESGLLTADKRLDRAAVTRVFTNSDKDLGPVVTAAITKCLGSYQNDVDQSLECKSGAEEFKKCLTREVFLNCPSSVWISSSECSSLKTKITNCPQFPVKIGGPGPGPR